MDMFSGLQGLIKKFAPISKLTNDKVSPICDKASSSTICDEVSVSSPICDETSSSSQMERIPMKKRKIQPHSLSHDDNSIAIEGQQCLHSRDDPYNDDSNDKVIS
jgi:hypothetical protein